jgi:regulator of protease activity HflC (stomatin/prohibitin superfamily)
VHDDVLQPGAHLVNPLSDVHRMSVQVQRDMRKHEAASRDLQDVIVSLGTNYHLDPTRAREVFMEIGMGWADVIIPNAESESLKAVVAKYPVADVLAKRIEIKQEVQDTLRDWLAKYGLLLDEVSFSDIAFSPEYADAIEKKQVEEQKALQKTYELQSAEKQAEIAKAVARGTADAVIEAARGQAESISVVAQARAAANERIAASLTVPGGDRALDAARLEKWDGKLPTVTGADGMSILVTKP